VIGYHPENATTAMTKPNMMEKPKQKTINAPKYTPCSCIGCIGMSGWW